MKSYLVIFISVVSILMTGCTQQPKKNTKTDTTRELTLKEINKVINLKMPISQKAGDDSIKIVNAEIERDGKTRDGVTVESDFIYKSFAIPEGITGKITLNGKIIHNEEDNNLYLYGLRATDYTFADKKLSEYVTDKDKKLIEQMVAGELSLIPVYHINPNIKNINIAKDKISLTYNGL